MKKIAWALQLPNGTLASRPHIHFDDGIGTALFRTKKQAVAASKEMFGSVVLSKPVKVDVIIKLTGEYI